MKKILKVVLSLVLIFSILTNNTIISLADTSNESSGYNFSYDNMSNYVADCISNGLINMDGTITSTPYISLATLHKYTYNNLTEALIDNPLLTFNSTFWKNIRTTLDAEFIELGTWRKDIYVMLIMDYLNYSFSDDVYESNLENKSNDLCRDIYNAAIDYADSEYIKNVNDLINNQSLSDAIDFLEQYGLIHELSDFNGILDKIKEGSDSALDYYEYISKALSIKKVHESNIKFLEQMKIAGSDNTYFVQAVEEVIKAYNDACGEISFTKGTFSTFEFVVKMCFEKLEDMNPELKIIFEGLNIYTSGLDWLFNSDDISDNNLKLLLLYTMGSYALTALNSIRDIYESNSTEENADMLINGFLDYLKYNEYATSNVYDFLTSTLFDGISNNIKNIFSNENQVKYEYFKKYLDYDIKFCETLKGLVNKSYKIYSGITTTINNSSVEDQDYDHTIDVYQAYQDALQNLTSSGKWTENSTVTIDMYISKDSAKLKTKVVMNSNMDISNYSPDDVSKIKIDGSADMNVLGQKYEYNLQYENGVAHYEYYKPNKTTADIEIDPNFFDFNSITSDMIEKEKKSGNKLSFTIPGTKMKGANISSVYMISGIENLSYDDVDVEVLINQNTCAVEKINMSFHASLTYQGYETEADYQINYSFKNISDD